MIIIGSDVVQSLAKQSMAKPAIALMVVVEVSTLTHAETLALSISPNSTNRVTSFPVLIPLERMSQNFNRPQHHVSGHTQLIISLSL